MVQTKRVRHGIARAFAQFLIVLLVVLAASASAAFVNAADLKQDVAIRACAALTARVDAIPGDGAVFLRSFDAVKGAGPIDEPSLATAAFTYDNALATIALVACNRVPQAQRIGAALLAAIETAGNADARLYNAYIAGGVKGSPKPNGWWSAEQNQWLQDGYQVGTATGNVAWAMLAFLTLSDRTSDARWCGGAQRLAGWTIKYAHGTGAADGFRGGVYGFEGHQSQLTWKSTEHNIDLAAAFAWLARCDASSRWKHYAAEAREFVGAQWDTTDGHFLIGTTTDGHTPNRSTSALDIQLWASMIPNAPAEWHRAIAYAERVHGFQNGFSFNADRDGVWIEGTAQAALAYEVLGRRNDATRLLNNISTDFSPGGLLFATRQGQLRTGLAVTPTSTTDDFRYYHWPHIGATAWAALAATRWNPFVGATLGHR
ncbi:MAG: hypothetical protein ABI451_03580 [Dokdonella sp.]